MDTRFGVDIAHSADDLREDALNERWVKRTVLGQVVVEFITLSSEHKYTAV